MLAVISLVYCVLPFRPPCIILRSTTTSILALSTIVALGQAMEDMRKDFEDGVKNENASPKIAVKLEPSSSSPHNQLE
jgi:hypothetical protein